jgi:putative two-component system response regulator
MAVLSTVFLMRRLLRPVAELQRGLERIGRGDLDTPMQLKNRTELGQLAETVNEMARQVKDSQKAMLAKDLEIIETQAEVIHTLGEVVENRSHETANHTVRVGQYAYLLATLAGLEEDEARLLQQAAPMHDIGKIGIPDAVLNKPGSYNDEERELMKQHAAIGFSILARSKRDVLQAAAVVAHQHHERWDGTGYPRGLAGYDIHIFGRIVAIADVFDALSFDRVYRKALSQNKVLEIMRAGRGTQFDPHILDMFLVNVNEFVVLKTAYGDGQARLSPEQELAITSALGTVESMETEPSEDLREPVEV